MLQADVAVCGEHSPCSGHTGFAPLPGVCFPRLHCSGSRLLYMERALHCTRFQPSGVPQKRGLGCASVLCLPRPEQLRQPGACRAHSPRVPRAFSPPGPSLSFPPHQLGACALCLAATLPADVDHPESQEAFG